MKTLISNMDIFEDYNYSSYLEDCNINDRTPEKEDSEDYYSFVYDSQEREEEDFFFTLSCLSLNNNSCLVTGYIGTWRGDKEIYPTVCNSLEEAIKKCISGGDYYRVEQEEGKIFVVSIDHDGQSAFQIEILSKEGKLSFEGYEEEEEDFDFTKESNFVRLEENYIY